jgi:hypothetical protein
VKNSVGKNGRQLKLRRSKDPLNPWNLLKSSIETFETVCVFDLKKMNPFIVHWSVI